MIDWLIGDSATLRAIWTFLAWGWPYIFTTIHVGAAIVASAHVVLYKRDVRAAIAWAGLIWLSPIVGSLLYAIFGINRIRRRASHLRTETTGPPALIKRDPSLSRISPASAPPAKSQKAYGLTALRGFVQTVSGRAMTTGNRVTPLINGDEGYPAMLGAIENAERSIALCTYIFDHDQVGKRFVEALADAMARGVTVRVLIDGVGARYSRPRITRLLQAKEVPVAKFLKSMSPVRNPYINLRNHRKILVVDGRIGFTGGLNIREGCMLSLDTAHPVQDTHFRFDGPVVRHMMEDFTDDWEFTTEEVLEGDLWFPDIETAGSVDARGVADGPDENFEAIRWSLLGALSAAERSVRITTPYFLPDQTLIAALSLAAMRGVKVEIVLPEVGNLRFVQWASTAQLWQVLVHGCNVWVSKPPFDHSKLMIVDGEWAFVGSANWDARSLRLNFEYNIECYDQELVSHIDRLIDAKIADGRPLSLDEVNSRSLPVKLRDGVARLMAPYL